MKMRLLIFRTNETAICYRYHSEHCSNYKNGDAPLFFIFLCLFKHLLRMEF